MKSALCCELWLQGIIGLFIFNSKYFSVFCNTITSWGQDSNICNKHFLWQFSCLTTLNLNFLIVGHCQKSIEKSFELNWGHVYSVKMVISIIPHSYWIDNGHVHWWLEDTCIWNSSDQAGAFTMGSDQWVCGKGAWALSNCVRHAIRDHGCLIIQWTHETEVRMR